MPRLIITADDCGLTEAINRETVALHKRGYISAASVMTNFPAHRHALELFSACPELDIGVHLNLTDGLPVTQFGPPHSHLLRDDRRFRDKFSLYLRGLFFNTGAIHWIRNELDSQMRRCLEAGVKPRHITTHHHFHTLPILREIVHELAALYQVEWVRGHNFRATLAPNQWLLRAQRRSPRYRFAMPDYMTGIQGWLKRPSVQFAQRVARLSGTVEIVAHPAPSQDPDFPAEMDYGTAPRHAEAQYLVRAIDQLQALGVNLPPRRL